ncbi:hypothetical protein [Zhongshania marina]|uniref:hypothetical protein n=1 Tax=Zhongshania marina TaxID=2304603 RepID=UPI001314F685
MKDLNSAKIKDKPTSGKIQRLILACCSGEGRGANFSITGTNTIKAINKKASIVRRFPMAHSSEKQFEPPRSKLVCIERRGAD